jgi:hypothetical protein
MPPPLAAPPLPGFVPPYEVAKIVREAGYDPLTRPRREGSTYVVRATNHRGILMRIVVDARSGAIRAVNRIVPGPGPYGVMGMMPPPYGDPYGPPDGPMPVGPPPGGMPPAYAVAPYGPALAPPRYPQAYPPPPYPPAYSEPEEYGMGPDMPGPPGRPLEADLNGPPLPPPPGYGRPPVPRPPRPRSPGLATHEAKPSRIDEKPVESPAVRPEPVPNAAIAPAPLPHEPLPSAPAVTPVPPPTASAPPPPTRKPPQPIQD